MKRKRNFLLIILICSAFFAQAGSIEYANQKEQAKSITKTKLLSVSNVEDLIDNFPKEDYVISTYKITLLRKNKEPEIFDACGRKLPVNVKEAIKGLSARDKILIEYIKGRKLDNICDDVSKDFLPAVFILKDE
jgi:hypothetical protein